MRKTRGRDLCSSAIWEGVRTRHASLPPSSATASPLVRTSARGGMLQWTLTVVAGPTNLDNKGNLKLGVTSFLYSVSTIRGGGGGGGYIGIIVFISLFVFVKLCPEDVFRTGKPFATKLSMVVHHHGQKCHTKKNGFYLQGQGHSEGL